MILLILESTEISSKECELLSSSVEINTFTVDNKVDNKDHHYCVDDTTSLNFLGISLNQKESREDRRALLKCLLVRHLTSSCCSAINSTRMWEYSVAPVYIDVWVWLKM